MRLSLLKESGNLTFDCFDIELEVGRDRGVHGEKMRMDKPESTSWKILADQKEQEWREILQSRMESIEKECKEKEIQLASHMKQFDELKENFKYNLKLLADREKELEKYDLSFVELKNSLNSKNAEISELKILVDDLKNLVKREEKTREELQERYQRRLRERQSKEDDFKRTKDLELQEERKEYEEFRRNLQLQLLNIQNELDTQKSELTIEFENAMKKREHEFRVQCDELNTKVLEGELKVKLLEKELELVRESSDQTAAVAEEAETSQRKLEKQLKQKDWELADIKAIKDAQITDLHNKLMSSESAMNKLQEDFQRKYKEMDRLVRDKEASLERVKSGFTEREQTLQATVQELQSKLEDGQIRERQLTWSHQDQLKDKDVQIEKLQEELSHVQEKWSRHVAELSRDNVARDLELTAAMEEQRRLKSEVEQRKEDLRRYRQDLQAAADREQQLEKAKAQLELDWQRRCEELERQQLDSSEEIIRKLSTAKNQAQALVKERERELQQRMMLIKSLHREGRQLKSLLTQHGVPLTNFVKYSLEESEEDEPEIHYVEGLEKENQQLKELIGQMRAQMESLGSGAAPSETKSVLDSSTNEEEIQELRNENRALKERLKSSRKTAAGTSQPPSAQDHHEVLAQVEGNSRVKSHIVALNTAIGTLRSEKVELAATAKKQQARIAHLENSLEEISKQPRQKQIQIDQLNYELNNCRRRHETEVAGLKSRLSDLEFQLSEARREADEYHRASLERNEELVALGNQIAALKLEMSESNPSINFGAQELYIQQLQDELSQLRKRAAALDVSDLEQLHKFSEAGTSSTDLKYKLKMAATRIIQLAKENQQLIQSNNRLRSELKEAEEKLPEKPVKSEPIKLTDVSWKTSIGRQGGGGQQTGNTPLDRLQQLERLQYQLTKQELQFAQRYVAGTSRIQTKDSFSSVSQNNTQVPEKEISFDSNHLETSEYCADDKNNTDFQPEVRLSAPDTDMLMSFSSGGGDSIQKVWQMLDEGSSSVVVSTPRSKSHGRQPAAGPTYRKPAIRNPESGTSFHLEGHQALTEVRPRQAATVRTTGNDLKLKNAAKLKTRVRNYNVKDDPSKQ